MSIAVAVVAVLVAIELTVLERFYPLLVPALRSWRYRAAERRDDRLYGPRLAAPHDAHRPARPIPIDIARTRHRWP